MFSNLEPSGCYFKTKSERHFLELFQVFRVNPCNMSISEKYVQSQFFTFLYL